MLVIPGIQSTTTPPTHPHVAASELDSDGLHLRGVSLRGPSHALFGGPRQDAFGILDTECGWTVFGVADGVGSCSLSQWGAEAALAAGLAALGDALAIGSDDALDAVLEAADTAVLSCATSLGARADDLCTTLTLAAICSEAESDGSRRCLVVNAGDSPALLLRDQEVPWVKLTPEADGPANLVQSYVPGAIAGATFLGVRLGPAEVLVVATDGFSTVLADANSGLGEGLRARWLPGPRPLMSFLVDLTFSGHHDDRTVVAVWNTPDSSDLALKGHGKGPR